MTYIQTEIRVKSDSRLALLSQSHLLGNKTGSVYTPSSLSSTLSLRHKATLTGEKNTGFTVTKLLVSLDLF